jgi:putative nucleotidyltransferase with HDIG domain
MTTFTPPPELMPLLDALAPLARAAGIDAYVVGGTVRDVLLRRPCHDLDLAVSGDALAWSRGVAASLGGHFVLLDDEHAVARIVLPAPRSDAVAHIDVAALHGSLDADLLRRDFTVDAMAAPLGAGDVIDPCGGLADIDARLVRMTAPAVLDDDPLRLLRGARIAAELGFAVEATTAGAIRARAPRVNEAAAERRRDELARIFATDDAYGAVRLLDSLGLLDALLPEVGAGRGVGQSWHAYDVFEHSLRAVEATDVLLAPSRPAQDGAWMWEALWRIFGWCEDGLRAYLAEEPSEGRSRASLLKIAALLHDVAKPQTRSVDPGGRTRFFGHADAGAAVARAIMRRLRFSSREAAFVALLVEEHLRPVQLAQVGEAPTRRALYHFHRDLGDAASAVLLLALADAAAARGPEMTSEGWTAQAMYMNSVLVRSREEEGILAPPRLLSGHDIMSALGIEAGPKVGRLLEALREAQAVGEVRDRDEALAFVKDAAREGPG